MLSYRVRHKESGAAFFLLASNPRDATEIVTMRIGATDGMASWETEAHDAPFDLRKGEVYDHEGRVVRDVML